jgi:DeoR/GlpR family transcriptional regulator of sugar metabolism
MAGKGYLTVREIADATNRSFAGVRKQITVLNEKGLLDEIRPPQMNSRV